MLALLAALLWTSVASAHDDGGCPPLPQLRTEVDAGALSPRSRACVTRHAEPAWVTLVVLDDLARKDQPEAAARATAWLPAAARPDDALLVAERALARDEQALARQALDRTVALSNTWTHPIERADRLARLAAAEAVLDPTRAVAWAQTVAWLGVLGEPLTRSRAACAELAPIETCALPVAPAVPPARRPTADDLVACRDLVHLWTRTYSGSVYASERDCLVRALDGLDGEALTVAGHLIVVLARRHRDREGGLIALQRVAARLPDDVATRAAIATLRAELGDPAGAAAWRGSGSSRTR